MARKRKKGTKSPPGPLMIHPDAAGIDIGATEIFVAVPLPAMRTRSGAFQRSRKISTPSPIGSTAAESRRWPWNRRACTGFRCFRSWRLAASRSA